MFDWALYLALVTALAIGYWQGQRQQKNSQRKDEGQDLSRQYIRGLNFLLDNQQDAAIESFIKALEVNSETLDTHLALGKLLRRRGEVDRAIRIHQNLLARPGLTQEQTQHARYELATDFSKAGLLDRAEGLLQELVEAGPFQTKALIGLLGVYRDEQEWEQGLVVLQSLSGPRLGKSYEKWAPVRAHFCCELAEQEIAKSDYKAVRQWLRQALNYDKYNPRAIMLLGRLEIASGNTQRGIQQLQKIVEKSPDYISEVLPHLSEGYKSLKDLKKYRDFLITTYQKNADSTLILAITNVIEQVDGQRAAAEFIAREVSMHPSGMGLNKLLDYYMIFTDSKCREYLSILKKIAERIIIDLSHYQCSHCGFKGQELHWLCPSCKCWGKIKATK